MVRWKLHYWPILTTVWFCLTFTVSFILAVVNDHVYPVIPYISDTGTKDPESCIFGQMLNMGAVFLFVTIYIKYKMIALQYSTKSKYYQFCNSLSFYIGALGSFGITIVANFQESNNFSVHVIGATIAFGFGLFYLYLHIWISWKTNTGTFLRWFRFTLSVCYTIAFFNTAIFSIVSVRQFDGDNFYKWEPYDRGYGFHLVATTSEWILVILYLLYILSSIKEFQTIEFEKVVFISK